MDPRNKLTEGIIDCLQHEIPFVQHEAIGLKLQMIDGVLYISRKERLIATIGSRIHVHNPTAVETEAINLALEQLGRKERIVAAHVVII